MYMKCPRCNVEMTVGIAIDAGPLEIARGITFVQHYITYKTLIFSILFNFCFTLIFFDFSDRSFKTGHPHGFVIFLLAKIHIISNLAKPHN